jgi:hypothetical protein
VRAILAVGFALSLAQVSAAAEGQDYFKLFRAVVSESRKAAPDAFKANPERLRPFIGFADSVDAALAKELPSGFEYLKRVRTSENRQLADQELLAAVKGFNSGLGHMMDAAGEEGFPKLVPSYHAWNSLETGLLMDALRRRLAAYEVRYGPDSERLNILEYIAVQVPPFRSGDAGPKAWEPIARLTPISLTSGASAPVSTVQAGVNYYFLNGPPDWLDRLGVENHIGFAAALQYLEPEKPLHFNGRPTFGFVLHLDRKEVGFTWTEARRQAQVTFGYAFQFVPLGM